MTGCLGCLLSTAALGTRAADADSSATTPFEVGVGVHLGLGKSDRARVRSLLEGGVFTSVRDEVLWSRVERERGRLAMPGSLAAIDGMLNVDSPALGLRPLLILDYGNALYGAGLPVTAAQREAFARYAAFVAARYKDQVAYLEIWNEWNEGLGSHSRPRIKGSADDYVALLRVVVPAIRRVAPTVRILAGATAHIDRRWSVRMAALGGLDLVDGFSVHPYTYAHTDAVLRRPERAIRGLQSLERDMRAAAGRAEAIPFYITEIGMPHGVAPNHLDEAEVADYLTRFLLLARAQPFVRGVWVYELLDRDVGIRGAESRFGLHDFNGRPREAMLMLRTWLRRLHGASQVSHQEDGDYHVVRWRSPDGDRLEAHWSTSGTVALRGEVGEGNPRNGLPARVGARPRFISGGSDS
ncbi:MAG: hypothetical protein KDH20_08805 [Rhodocyclaceae bacterium]|nr:hypothetical protein [Rhodocyclaceae bacterium]